MRDLYRRWWCGDEPIMGMDLKDDVVLLAQSTTLAVARDPANLCAIPLPSGVIEKGVVKDAVRLVSIFRESHYLSELSGCRCAVAVPAVASFTACLDIPDDILFANLSEAYSWALNRLSLDASKLIGRAYLQNRHPPKKAQLFLAVARLSAKEILEETFQALGLELSCITLRSIALHKGAAILSKNSRRPVRIWIDFTVTCCNFLGTSMRDRSKGRYLSHRRCAASCENLTYRVMRSAKSKFRVRAQRRWRMSSKTHGRVRLVSHRRIHSRVLISSIFKRRKLIRTSTSSRLD